MSDRKRLEIIIGSSIKTRKVNSETLLEDITSLSNLSVITYCNFSFNTATVVVLANDTRYYFTYNLVFSSEPINMKSLIYTNNSITSLSLIISPVRLDYALRLLQRENSSSFSTFCKTEGCAECLPNRGNLCIKCNTEYSLYNNICIKTIWTQTQKRISVKQRNLNNPTNN